MGMCGRGERLGVAPNAGVLPSVSRATRIWYFVAMLGCGGKQALRPAFGMLFAAVVALIMACGSDVANGGGTTTATGGSAGTAGSGATSSSGAAGGGSGGSNTGGGGSGGASDLAVGVTHACEMTDGTVRCWGGNLYGQLGLGIEDDQPHTKPKVVPMLQDVVQLAAGSSRTCARLKDGTLSCWGGGGLGDGTSDNKASPQAVPGVSGVVRVELGSASYAVLDGSGEVLVWGNGTSGQLGLGVGGPEWSPTAVPGLQGVVQVAASYFHACARLAGGAVSCWGGNEWGQIGDGTQVDQNSPTPVLAGVTEIAVGGLHSCGVFSGTTVKCWGFNNFGQLGPGTISNFSLVPLDVPGVTGAIQLVLGTNHSCALLGDGTVQCWGYNAAGQLGRGTFANGLYPDPEPVVGLSDVVQLSGTAKTMCARRVEGHVDCWGENGWGQLGDGTTENKAWPTPVVW